MTRMILAAILLAMSSAAQPAQSAQQPTQPPGQPAPPAQHAKPIHAEGCVQAGVEGHCLVLKDAKTGVLYNLLVKEPRPQAGIGIEFSGEPFQGMTACMQGRPVTVTHWSRTDSLKCTAGEAPKQ